LYLSRVLTIESVLSAEELRNRVRLIVERCLVPDTTQFRLRQIYGWRYRERASLFELQPEYWSGKSRFGAQFVGHIETAGSGSRVIGIVREHWLTRAIFTLILLGIVAAVIATIHGDPWILSRETVKAMTIASVMAAAGVLLIRFDLHATEQIIRDGILLAQSVQVKDLTLDNPRGS